MIVLTGNSYECVYNAFQIRQCSEDNDVDSIPGNCAVQRPMRLAKYKLEVFVLGLDDWESKGFVYYDNRDCGYAQGCPELAAQDCFGQNDITVRFDLATNNLYLYPTQNTDPGLSGWTQIMSPENNGYEINWWEVKDCSYHLELDFAGDPDVPTGFSVGGSVGEHPQLSWNANSDTDLDGYKIYYKESLPYFTHLVTLNKSKTSYTDLNVNIASGKFMPLACYKISAVDLGDNESNTTFQDCVKSDRVSKESISSSDTSKMENYILYPAFPNPFNPTTKIKFYVPHNTNVTIDIFNSIGEKVDEVINMDFEKGLYSFTFDGSRLSSGVYYYRMTTQDYTATKKIQLVK